MPSASNEHAVFDGTCIHIARVHVDGVRKIKSRDAFGDEYVVQCRFHIEFRNQPCTEGIGRD